MPHLFSCDFDSACAAWLCLHNIYSAEFCVQRISIMGQVLWGREMSKGCVSERLRLGCKWVGYLYRSRELLWLRTYMSMCAHNYTPHERIFAISCGSQKRKYLLCIRLQARESQLCWIVLWKFWNWLPVRIYFAIKQAIVDWGIIVGRPSPLKFNTGWAFGLGLETSEFSSTCHISTTSYRELTSTVYSCAYIGRI